MGTEATASLWTCDRCGRSFANLNQTHNCHTLTVAEHLADKSELAVSIYRQVEAVLRGHGEFREHAQQGGIGFISRMTFAGVALRQRWADLWLLLPRPLDSARVRKLDLFGPTSWGHQVRLGSPGDVDAEVEAWLGESLRRGDQETLDPGARIDPLSPSQLALFWTGLTARCRTVGEDLVIRLPTYVADAIDLADDVMVRLAGIGYSTEPVHSGDSVLIEVDPSTGLGEGDEVDLYITGSRR